MQNVNRFLLNTSMTPVGSRISLRKYQMHCFNYAPDCYDAVQDQAANSYDAVQDQAANSYDAVQDPESIKWTFFRKNKV